MLVIIPAAGNGQRFKSAGYNEIKPLIPVAGQPMIKHLIDQAAGNDIRIGIQMAHANSFDPDKYEWIDDHLGFTAYHNETRGALETVLGMIEDFEGEFLVVNCDNYADISLKYFTERAGARGAHSILLFKASGPKWSYAKVGISGGRYVIEQVAEKQEISEYATAGYYYFASANRFRKAAQAMMARNDRVNGEFYLAPVYNYLIEMGDEVIPCMISPEEFYGFGTPEDLRANEERFARHLELKAKRREAF